LILTKNMVRKISSEKFWELYKSLPQELKEVLADQETGDVILSVCQRNGIPEKTEEIVDSVSQVLIGLSPPDEFQQVLERELKIEPEVAKKVNQEIYRFIFYPVKANLEELYRKELVSIAEPSKIVPPPEEKPEPQTKTDVYREPVE